MALAIAPVAQAAGRALVQAAPAIKDKVVQYVANATQGRVNTLDGVSGKLASDKDGLALVLSGMVRAGMSPADILDDRIRKSIRDKDLTNLLNRLTTEFEKSYGSIDNSSALRTGGDVIADGLLAAGAVKRLRRVLFGTRVDDETIKAVHRDLRLFLGTSDDLLGVALRLRESQA